MQTTSDDLPRRVVDALGRGSRSDRTLRLADAFAAALDDEAAGAQLPSLRTLAGETGAHRNTVRAALELLADAGVVERRPGGRYRSAGARSAIVIVEPREPWPWIGAAVEPAGAARPRAGWRSRRSTPQRPASCWRPRSSWTRCGPACRAPRCSASGRA